MARRKIVFLGDSPSGFSGLGRILRDVALRTHLHMADVFEVATIGWGAAPSSKLPFFQYHARDVKDWIVRELPMMWHDFTGGDPAILFCFWDLSRLLWLSHPDKCPDEQVRTFLMCVDNMQKWVYPATDSEAPNGHLPIVLHDAAKKFDRFLNYTEWSSKITGYPDWIHHGIDETVFYPRGRKAGRKHIKDKFGVDLHHQEILIGVVATNQPRKDWPLAFQVIRNLRLTGIKANLWIHTDLLTRHWDLQTMNVDFGIPQGTKIIVTPYGMTDEDMAMMYCACDCSLGIAPEGMGYSQLESLACGTPCITGSYGGQSDFVATHLQIQPCAFRYEGVFSSRRPVYDAVDFSDKVCEILAGDGLGTVAHPLPTWDIAWPKWDKWLRREL